MLMDLVFRTTPGGTRLHYHELMQSIHQGMHALQVMPRRVHPLGLQRAGSWSRPRSSFVVL